jgi:hypothetical protein
MAITWMLGIVAVFCDAVTSEEANGGQKIES